MDFKVATRLAVAMWITSIGLPQHSSAQAGPFIDWLQKMSGPQFWPAGATVSFGYWPGQRISSNRTERLLDRVRLARAPIPAALAAAETAQRTDSCLTVLASDLPLIRDGNYYHEETVDRIRIEASKLTRIARDSGKVFYEDEIFSDRICRWQGAVHNVVRDFRSRDPMHGFVLRLGLFRGHDTLDEEPDTTDVEILAFQPTLEYRHALIRDLWIFSVDVGVESGVSLLYFHGKDMEPFWHTTVPVLANLHPFARHPWLLLRGLRVGGGGYIIPAFRSDAFAPGIQTLSEKTEWSWTVFTAFELSLNVMGSKSCSC